MIRTQIQLSEEQVHRLKTIAATRGLSVAELVRQCVDDLASPGAVDAETRRRRAIAAVGRFRSGKPDVAQEHDRYLAESYQ